MNTVEGAIFSMVVLSASGALPAIALVRARWVVLPLLPLTGAILASLAVTAMALLGGTLAQWFSIISASATLVVLLCWWRRPNTRPWSRDDGGRSARTFYVIASIGCLIVCVFGLSILKVPLTEFDARTIWLMHPVWYLDGHATTVATLRNRALLFSHAPYPPLVGGAVAVSWLVSGVESDRLGVVMVALLNVIAIFAAASAMIEVARPLATRNDDRRRFIRVQAAGIAMVVVLMMVAFAVAGQYIANGYADMLWSSAAVGAVVYGLVLPQEPSNMYVALILAVVAGLTKLEGSFTGAVIIGLVVMRMVLHNRTSEHRRPWTQLLTPALSAWLVIAAWPIVIHILGARPDMPMDGVRMGNDVTRLHASLLGAWGQLHLLALAVPVAVVSALCLKRARQMAGLGNDLWIWVAIAAELIVVMTAYVVGPGNIAAWLNVTIFRITIFPTLLLWWLMATWAIIGVSEVRWVQDSNSSEAKVPTEP